MTEEAKLDDLISTARKAMKVEADAILAAADRINGNLLKAVEVILNHNGKVVVCGIGKSGHIGQKIVATLCSTGTQAVFLHAGDAAHGDLGIYAPGDPTIFISKSGATGELLRLIPMLRNFNSPIITILGNLNSPLAKEADVVLDARVPLEADPLGVVPTSSTTVALAIGDTLASVLMHARRFTEKDFARFHPGGQLGRNLNLTVKDVMQKMENVAAVGSNDPVHRAVIEMTEKPWGAACVLNEKGVLLGLVTEGDLRRSLQRYDDLGNLKVADIMTKSPVTATPDMSLKEALHLMEDRPSQIYVLPVVEKDSRKCLGLIRLHDIYQPTLY
jgi:arabinose-5-phosphate isomerase